GTLNAAGRVSLDGQLSDRCRRSLPRSPRELCRIIWHLGSGIVPGTSRHEAAITLGPSGPAFDQLAGPADNAKLLRFVGEWTYPPPQSSSSVSGLRSGPAEYRS